MALGPSENYPDIYAATDAVRVFKEARVLGDCPLETRLRAGDHFVGRATQGDGHLLIRGPAFSNVSMVGAGIGQDPDHGRAASC